MPFILFRYPFSIKTLTASSYSISMEKISLNHFILSLYFPIFYIYSTFNSKRNFTSLHRIGIGKIKNEFQIMAITIQVVNQKYQCILKTTIIKKEKELKNFLPYEISVITSGGAKKKNWSLRWKIDRWLGWKTIFFSLPSNSFFNDPTVCINSW